MQEAELRDLEALARRLAVDPAVADDLVQEACVSALSGGQRALARGPWLRGVLRNRARMATRGQSRRRARDQAWAQLQRAPDAADPEDAVARGRLLLSLHEAMGSLPEPERSMVRARWFEERTSESIAAEHGVSAATVRWRLARAMQRLRRSLGAEDSAAAFACLPALIPAEVGGGGSPSHAAAPRLAAPGSTALWSLAVAAALALSTAAVVVSMQSAAPTEPPSQARSENAVTRPHEIHRRLATALPSLACATGLAGGCLSAAPLPDDVAPESRDVEAEPPGPAAVAAEASDERPEAAAPSCADQCLVSVTPIAMEACMGDDAFADCAVDCVDAHCPDGDVTYDPEVLDLPITTRGDGWVPQGCDDAVAWSRCSFECAGVASCSDAVAPRMLCELECRADEAAAAAPGT